MQLEIQIVCSKNVVKSNLSLYSLYYAKACNEFAGPISASLRPGKTAAFEKMPQRRRAIGNTASNLTGPRFELQASRSRDECIIAPPTGRLKNLSLSFAMILVFNGAQYNAENFRVQLKY